MLRGRSQAIRGCAGFVQFFQNGHSHVASITPLAAVAFLLTDTTFDADSSVFAPLTGTLAVTTLLTFPAPLTPGFGGKIFIVHAK